jgi:hypothetical protein
VWGRTTLMRSDVNGVAVEQAVATKVSAIPADGVIH